MSSKKAAAGSFGAPKPLPGQAGYKLVFPFTASEFVSNVIFAESLSPKF